jgi:hypothetical protein
VVEEVVDIVIWLVEMVDQVLVEEMQFVVDLVIHLQSHLLKVMMEAMEHLLQEHTTEVVVEEQEE